MTSCLFIFINEFQSVVYSPSHKLQSKKPEVTGKMG